MTAEQYLEQIATCKARIQNKMDEIQQLQDISENISPHISDMRVAQTPDPHRAQEVWSKLADAKLELIREVLELLILKENVIHNLEKLDGREYDALHGFYVLGLSAQTLADRMHYTREHIYNIKRKGIENLQKIIDSDETFHKISQNFTSKV